FFQQSVDKAGESDHPLALQALSRKDRPRHREGPVEVLVDDDIVVFAPLADFLASIRKPPLDCSGRILGASLKPGAKFAKVWRQHKNAHEIAPNFFDA